MVSTSWGEAQEYVMMQNVMSCDVTTNKRSRPTRTPERRRTFRHKMMRRQSHNCDLVILHTKADPVFQWARYLKGEVESQCRAHTQATLINCAGFLPEVQENVRRTINNTPVLLVIISPDLVTQLESLRSYSFDFVSLDNMAGAVLFFCGVDEQSVDLKKYFPNYEAWIKFTAHPEESKIKPIFEHIAKLINEVSDSSPEPELTRGGRRASDGVRVNRSPSSATRPPHRRRRATLKQPIQIFPDRGRCDQLTDVAVILSDAMLPCDHLEIRTVGESTNETKIVKATRLNNYTFQITMPAALCEDVRLYFMRENRAICSTLFHYESPLDDVEPVAQLLISAMDALCELLATAEPHNHSSRIDEKLSHLFQSRDIPIESLEHLFYHYSSSTRMETSSRELPTLLHMIAKFGLLEMAALLVDLPGAKEALSITNSKGHYPNDIARVYRHSELASFFEDFMGLLVNEEDIYSSMKAYINLNHDEVRPLSSIELNCTIPIEGASTTASSTDDSTYVCHSQIQDLRGVRYMNTHQQQDLYMPMGVNSSAEPCAFQEPTPPWNLHLSTPVPGPGIHEDNDYLSMRKLEEAKIINRRAPPPRPPRDIPESPGSHKLERGSGIDLGSADELDDVDIASVAEQPDESSTDTPPQDTPTEGAPTKDADIQLPTPEGQNISSPIVPFDDLLAPNAKAPQLNPSILASDGQAELADILYQVRDGSLTLQDAECLVDGWKKQYNAMNHGRWKNRSFKEKQKSIKELKDSSGKTAEKVKKELQQTPKPRTSGIMDRIFRRKKAPPVKNKQVSDPVPASEPMVDLARIQLLQRSYDAECAHDMSNNPICQSIPEVPVGLVEDSKRFSTISTSSSSSTVSSMSRTSYGSQPDSGIDVPIREESPALTGSSSYVYDKPPHGPPRPVLPVPISKHVASSDEAQSGYEDLENWLEPDGGSIRSRMKSDSSTQSAHSIQSLQSTNSDTFEDTTPPVEDLEEPPPIPPRSRRSSACSITDIPPPGKFSGRSKIPPRKHRSGLPQPLIKPAIGPKPNRTLKTDSSSSDDQANKPGTSGISIASVLAGATSTGSSPRALRPPANYSNVICDLNAKLRTAKLNGGTPKGTPIGTPIGTPRCSTSDDSEAPDELAPAPPVPPRTPRD